VVIPNPVDLDRFRRATVTPADGRALRILFIGRISVRKGIDAVVELSHRLRDLSGLIELEVIGDRTQWSDYRPLLADLDPSVALYRGGLTPDQVPQELARADLLVQPSTYEPFGLTVAEALASGVPAVVTTEVGAAEDVAGECVSRVPPGDAGALETAVRALLDRMSDGRAERLRAEARAEAERLFDPAHVCGAIAQTLRDVAG
jgi:glycosyltransferase involved in cell wall biosynthesis